MATLLTGATGFLGQALLPRLADRGEVFALHRAGSQLIEVGGVTWIEQDLSRPLSDTLPTEIDAVIHLAQSDRYADFPLGAVDVFEVNAQSTVRLLDYARRADAETFVLASTGAVYAPGQQPVRESDAPAPPNFYAASKLAAEHAAVAFRGLLRAHVLRPFFIYGAGQQHGRFLPGIVARVREGRAVSLAGAEGIRLNPIHLDDAVEVMLRSLELDEPATLNMAGPEPVSIRQIAEIVAEVLGREVSFEAGDSKPDLVASIDRLTEVLGRPTVGMREGIDRTLAAARA
jgi:nucleoside-diphosphate-sugar epimerase